MVDCVAKNICQNVKLRLKSRICWTLLLSCKPPVEWLGNALSFHQHFLFCANDFAVPSCWKMCASTTMVSLKFPLQDPLQAAATAATAASTTLPQFLHNWSVCQQTDLFIQHHVEIVPSKCYQCWVIKTSTRSIWIWRSVNGRSAWCRQKQEALSREQSALCRSV